MSREKVMASLSLKEIRRTETGYRFSYEVDYEVELMPSYFARSSQEDIPPSVTGELTAKVAFSHGNRRYPPGSWEIERDAKKEIRELLPNLIKQITPE